MNKRGMSLIETMIAVAAAGGLALLVAMLVNQANRGVKGTRFQTDVATAVAFVNQLLNTSGKCETALLRRESGNFPANAARFDNGASAGAGVGVVQGSENCATANSRICRVAMDGTNATNQRVFLEKGQTLQGLRLKDLNFIKLAPWEDVVLNGQPRRRTLAELRLTFEDPAAGTAAQGLGAPELIRPIRLTIYTDQANGVQEIRSCAAIALTQEEACSSLGGIWDESQDPPCRFDRLAVSRDWADRNAKWNGLLTDANHSAYFQGSVFIGQGGTVGQLRITASQTDPDSLGPNYQNFRGLRFSHDSDLAFFGMIDRGADRKDTVIAFGDNTNDQLSFVYKHFANPPAEVMTLQANGHLNLPGQGLTTTNLTTTSVARFEDQVQIPTGAGNDRVLTSDAIGSARWGRILVWQNSVRYRAGIQHCAANRMIRANGPSEVIDTVPGCMTKAPCNDPGYGECNSRDYEEHEFPLNENNMDVVRGGAGEPDPVFNPQFCAIKFQNTSYYPDTYWVYNTPPAPGWGPDTETLGLPCAANPYPGMAGCPDLLGQRTNDAASGQATGCHVSWDGNKWVVHYFRHEAAAMSCDIYCLQFAP